MASFNPLRLFRSAPQPQATAQIVPRPSASPWERDGVPGPSSGLVDWLKRQLGKWSGPQQAQSGRAEDLVTGEKAAAGPRDVVFPWFLPYADDYTQETAVMRLAYRRMMADPRIKTALLGKLYGVASLEINTLPADKNNARDRAIAQYVDWVLNKRLHGGIPGLVWSVLSGGLIDGYSVCEKVWHLEEQGRYQGLISLDSVKAKDVGQDMVVQTDEYRNIVGLLGLRYNAGKEFSPADFLIWRHLPLYDNPTGQSDLRAAYQSYWMLDTVTKLRAIHAEKSAIPMLVGQWANPTVKTSLEASLAKAKSQRWLSIPEQTKVEALDMAGSATTTFKEFVQDLYHDIFLSIQGAILQTLEGSTVEGRGNTQVHQSTAEKFVWFLANSVETLLNDHTTGLVKDIVDLNFAGVSEYPQVALETVDENLQLRQMQIDTGLIHMGLDLSKEDLYERYGRNPPESPDDTLHGIAPTAPGMGRGAAPQQGGPQLAHTPQTNGPAGVRIGGQMQQPDARLPGSNPNPGGGLPSERMSEPRGGAAARPFADGQPERDANGGFLPPDEAAAERAKAVDLISMPPDAPVNSCGLCKFFDAKRSFCTNKKVLQPVAPVQCCNEYDRPGVLRGYQIEGFAELPVPHVRQSTPYSCGAAALAAVARHFGLSATEAQLAQAMGTSPTDGTPPEAMLAGAEHLGLQARGQEGLTPARVQQALAQGHPVIVCLQAYGSPQEMAADEAGHWVVLTGADGGTFTLVDPASDSGEPVRLSAEELAARWHDESADGRKWRRFGIVVAGSQRFSEPASDNKQQTARLMAGILYGLYGEAALGYLHAGNQEAGAQKFAEWNPLLHPRGAHGRFIPSGSDEARAAAQEAVAAVLGGDKTATGAESLMQHLSILTVAQLKDLYKQYGQKPPGRLRQQLVDGIMARLEATPPVAEQKKIEGKSNSSIDEQNKIGDNTPGGGEKPKPEEKTMATRTVKQSLPAYFEPDPNHPNSGTTKYDASHVVADGGQLGDDVVLSSKVKGGQVTYKVRPATVEDKERWSLEEQVRQFDLDTTDQQKLDVYTRLATLDKKYEPEAQFWQDHFAKLGAIEQTKALRTAVLADYNRVFDQFEKAGVSDELFGKLEAVGSKIDEMIFDEWTKANADKIIASLRNLEAAHRG